MVEPWVVKQGHGRAIEKSYMQIFSCVVVITSIPSLFKGQRYTIFYIHMYTQTHTYMCHVHINTQKYTYFFMIYVFTGRHEQFLHWFNVSKGCPVELSTCADFSWAEVTFYSLLNYIPGDETVYNFPALFWSMDASRYMCPLKIHCNNNRIN